MSLTYHRLNRNKSTGKYLRCYQAKDVQLWPKYRQEVAAEYAVIDRLLYSQQCRSSLGRCIASGSARLCPASGRAGLKRDIGGLCLE